MKSILSRSNEIKEILMSFLNNEDLIIKILETEKKININESYLYWKHIQTNNIYVVNPYFKRIRSVPGNTINLHNQIIRMNGSLEKVREENEGLKILQKNNELWADGWMRGIRF